MRAFTVSLVACAFVFTTANAFAQQPASTSPQTPARERVTGIGGFFFRSQDPKAMAEWYEKHLGVTQTPKSYDSEPWRQQEGMTVFAPFSADSKYFGRPSQQWMINFRVRDLDAMVAQLKKAGITVEVDTTLYPNGRFGRLQDP